MTGKSSFILYADLIHTVNKLSDQKAGQLFKLILSYVNDENPEASDPLVDIAFEPIKQRLKKDLKKWEEIREKRSDAGKASANKRKQIQQVLTSVESVEQNKQVSTVSVNVSDSVSVNEKNKKNGLPELPTELNHIKEEWSEWIAYRKEIKKPLTKSAVKKQFKLLIENSSDAKDIINNSIQNSYQGLFAKDKKKTEKQTYKNFDE